MSTKKQNVDLFRRVNENYLHQIGPDGQYNRDRIFRSLGIAPGKDGDYGRNFGLNDKQRKQVQAAIKKELGFKFPGGIEIDKAANINENEGVSKYAKDWKTYAAIGAGLTGAGAFGIGPLAGVFGADLTVYFDRFRWDASSKSTSPNCRLPLAGGALGLQARRLVRCSFNEREQLANVIAAEHRIIAFTSAAGA